MNLKAKYTPVSVSDPEFVRDFLSRALGFSFSQKTTISGSEEAIIVGENEESGSYLLLMKHKGTSESHIIINTEDCLKDYHNLVGQGVKEVSKPQYTALGLTAEVTDEAGNHYILLEERNYQEN